MELLDKVIVYEHIASDDEHTARDYDALVVGIVDEETIDVVLFPPGGPIQWRQVSLFEPEDFPRVGSWYWREPGTEPPDLNEAFAHYSDPRWQRLIQAQDIELRNAPLPDHEKIRARQLEERKALAKAIRDEAVEEDEAHA